MFLYMQDNVPRRSGKCCATVRGMFLCGEDFVDEAGGVMHNRFFLFPMLIYCNYRIIWRNYGLNILRRF